MRFSLLLQYKQCEPGIWVRHLPSIRLIEPFRDKTGNFPVIGGVRNLQRKAGVKHNASLYSNPGEKIAYFGYRLFENVCNSLLAGSAHRFCVGVEAFDYPAFTELNTCAVCLDVIFALAGDVVQ